MSTPLKDSRQRLDDLRIKHLREEKSEGERNLIDDPRPQKVNRPNGGHLPESSKFLERLYKNGRMAKEKKPGLFDHLRSIGPWMVSIDEEPLSVLDGMSQTATLTHGFSPDCVTERYMEGVFGPHVLTSFDTNVSDFEDVKRYAENLANRVPLLNHVSFTNSGAEANEKAFALCRPSSAYPEAKRVLGFKGSFHGRTLLALQTTWNPAKRAPFELPSYLSVFADFPLRDVTKAEETDWPLHFTSALTSDSTTIPKLRALIGSGTELFDRELESLIQVAEAVNTGEIFAVIIEPMQSEGGDRYATARFYRALRLLTRNLAMPLIFDEVQTGFGLGGPFDWSSAYGLIDGEGNLDAPDAITYAKRAQVGVCISRFPDPEPTSAHIASMIRADITTNLMDFEADAKRVENWIKPRLEHVSAQYPNFVGQARSQGFAFAFDLPTPEHLNAYLGQRFWRGAVVFGAGVRTVRYRLSNAFAEKDVELLFSTIEQSLSYLAENGATPPPNWRDVQNQQKDGSPDVRIRALKAEDMESYLPRLMEIEALAYEAARRDSRETLSIGFAPDGVAIIAEIQVEGQWQVVGSALAGPIEHFSSLDGPSQDPNLGSKNSAYSIALTIHPDFHGQGLGRRLKQAQLQAARSLMKADGGPRYLYMVGRNRVGMTASMGHLNDSFGAYTVKLLSHQYGDTEGQARYYRIPLRGFAPQMHVVTDRRLHWSAGISTPFAMPPESLLERACDGSIFGPTVNKVTICNYVTPSVVRAVEWAAELTPELPHLYLSSGRDELIDKSVRLLRYKRNSAEVCLSFEGTYVGHTSATARAVSCESVHLQGKSVFDWPHLPHPEQGIKEALSALDQAVLNAGGAEKILGLFIEPVGERSGKIIDADAADALNHWCRRNEIPMVAVDTVGGFGRCGEAPFAYQDVELQPDLVAWWPGGQTGFLHVCESLFISKPLMMVSTWDGDELSMIRFHHQSMYALSDSEELAHKRHEMVFSALERSGLELSGRGAYRLINLGETAHQFIEGCRRDGLELKAFANGKVALALPLNLSQMDAERGLAILLANLNESPPRP